MIMNFFKLFSLLLIIVLAICGAYASTITITSLPSAANTGLPYVWTENVWINWCPNCGHYGTLVINPKGTHEKEITCSMALGGCDSDYCGSSGKEKGHIGSYLIRAETFYFQMPNLGNYNYSVGGVT